MPPLPELQQNDQPAPSPLSTTEATNASQLNQVLGKLVEGMQSQASDLIAAIQSITTAVTNSLIGGSTGATANKALVSKGTSARALQPTVVDIDPATGDIDTQGGNLTVEDIAAADVGATNIDATTSLTRNGTDVAIVNQIVAMSFTFKYPEDETLFILLNAPFAFTITNTTTITEVGTSTVTLDAGSGTTSPNSASTTQDSVAQSLLITSSGYISVTFASTSSDCENLCLTIAGTTVLAS